MPAPAGAIAPLTQVRGTLITAALKALADRNLVDRYFDSLAADDRVPVRAIIARPWVPWPLDTEHHRACD